LDQSLGPLQSGHVVIIGGGPGGTACALALQRMATEMGRKIEITLIEGKQFVGEMHHNQCVGVLSPPLPELLWNRLGVKFPYQLSRSFISQYVIHTAREQISLDDKDQHSVALRRVQYDAFMLEAVKQRGITVIPARAMDLEFHADHVVVYTDNSPFQADVIVGAFGMDDGSSAMFNRLTPYRPPQALSSIVTKYHPKPEDIQAFGPCIHAFLPSNPKIEFGGVTPKGNHLTINIAGSNVDADLMVAFLNLPEVRAILPNFNDDIKFDFSELQFYKGRFPRSLAHGYYGDRYVLVGDAAGLVRAFKGKGVTSAVLTGIRAAETILQHGISGQAFYNHYCSLNKDITQDLPYGQVMRHFTIFLAHYQLLDPVIRAAKQNPQLQSALFDAVSAHAPYRQVIQQSLHPEIILAVLRSWIKNK
jgi:digeranylgeranylglycerophospholipid reductase